MSFQSLGFLVFLAVTVCGGSIAARGNYTVKSVWLCLSSLFFYATGGNWISLGVLAVGIGISRWAVYYLSLEKPERNRRFCAVLAAFWHIMVLIGFKYAGFITGGTISPDWVPLGLSFFTFQQLWLLKEVYTGQFFLQRGDSLLLYGLFFPVIASGPILKPQNFFHQLRESLCPDWHDVAAGLYSICCGTIKKVLLADSFGVVVNNGWSNLSKLSTPGAWLVVLAYTLQLYFDFSGYCDIAAGAARLLGIRLPINFNSPYRALSVTEFWKRWHITLTTFLRECVYFPLGGSLKGPLRAYWNIFLVFLVSGLWHGAGWTFLIWGALHGLAQITERALRSNRAQLPKAVQWALTFLFVNFAWVFFRAPDLSAAGELLAAAIFGGFGQSESWLLSGLFSKETGVLQILFPVLKPYMNLLRTALLYGTGLIIVLLPRNTAENAEHFRPGCWQLVWLAILTAWSILSFTGITTFIYSNF